jgi:hypothetical protein
MATIRVEAFKDKPAAELQKAKLELRGFFVSGPEPADDAGWDGTQAGGSADNVFSGGPESLWVIFAKK